MDYKSIKHFNLLGRSQVNKDGDLTDIVQHSKMNGILILRNPMHKIHFKRNSLKIKNHTFLGMLHTNKNTSI